MRPLRERYATTAVFLANGFGIGAWAVEVPRVKDKLLLGDSLLGVALFAFALGAIVAMPLAGRLAPKLGSGRATALLGVLFAAAFPLPALAPNAPLLCAALLLLGALNGALDVSMNGHASAIEKVWHAPIMSSFHAAWSAGGLAGAAVGTVLQTAGFGVLSGLALPAIPIAALIAGAAMFSLRDVGTRPEAASAGGLTLPQAGVVKLAALAFLCMMTEGAIADWSAVYLRTALPGHADSAGVGYTAFAFAMAACRVVGDAFVRRLGAVRVVALGGLLSAAGLAAVLAAPALATAVVGFICVGIGLANVVPVIFSAAGRTTDPPVTGVSMAATAGYAGFLVGPPVIGFGAGLVGLRLALGVLVFATLAVCLAGSRAVRDVDASRGESAMRAPARRDTRDADRIEAE
ncbi:MFS transporter [Paraburkholderia silvatlantica]|uniref:MFS family permease n=1 Tax=Paraburkholderia silvatlantica TaxID=321895 RepID=A0ABR6FHF4_9BURK|nr:MFS transporter [Paraburkholderia silvatlantica]MBB2926851.1 MFS family permease [Paraburkholderia silvatlantica]PVY37523.1 fucose permease [Paraburkholderia silvatlantica]PXW42485.1 fucose permease [Paraburkholderia silvatlantica]